MILITGANGKTGKAILTELVRRGHMVRCLVHRDAQSPDLLALGAVDVVCGDMILPEIALKAADGVETIYHICPNMHPDEAVVGRVMLAAANDRKVSSFIFHSVLHPQITKMRHHWNKLLVEQEIFTSGISYSIIQPTAYMQNLLAYWPMMTKDGVYAPPYSQQTQLGLVDLMDVAEAAVKIILQPEFRGGIFELVGTPAYSQEEVAEIIGTRIGKRIQTSGASRLDWEGNARRGQMPEYTIQTLIAMFDYYAKYGMGGSSMVLEWILGRKPTSLEQFVDRILTEIKN